MAKNIDTHLFNVANLKRSAAIAPPNVSHTHTHTIFKLKHLLLAIQLGSQKPAFSSSTYMWNKNCAMCNVPTQYSSLSGEFHKMKINRKSFEFWVFFYCFRFFTIFVLRFNQCGLCNEIQTFFFSHSISLMCSL